ncbi:MAG: UbiD family decarboxylase [Deltaproteobacteria bacterium]|nr:UbiD family decarboxylase [Deltaproteobacteria bacterium]
MPKSLSSFLEDCRREIPNEVVHVEREVDPANYDVSAIIKHLGAARKFPMLIFDRPRNLHGRVSDFKLVMNFTISQRKTQIALGLPKDMTRAQMAEACVEIERNRVAPVVVENREAPVMENVRSGDAVDLHELPIMRHHYMDGGPYITLCTIAKDRRQGIYNASYHRMEIKSRNHTTHYHSQHHQWIIFRDHEDQGMECPVATVLGHHPAFYMGACYTGPFEVSEYDVIGAYLGEPLRVTPSTTWGDDLLIPADAEIVIEGALIPGERIVDGPFGEAPGYLGPQRFFSACRYEVRAINYRSNGMYQSVITPEGDKPWLDLPREGAYLRRIREAVPGVTAVCKAGRHAHYNIFIAMKKLSEGDPGRAAGAALTELHAKHIFVFDDDIDVYNPTEILWALATRVQPHRQVSIMQPTFTGNYLDPTVVDETKTSVMIVDATRPLDRPFSPVSKVPDEAMARIKVEDYIPGEVLAHIPVDRTTYWS